MECHALKHYEIQHCKELTWEGKRPQIEEILPFFGHVEVFSMNLRSDLSGFLDELFSHFRESRKIRGSLRHLHIQCRDEELNLQHSSLLRAFDWLLLGTLHIYKMSIEGGMAYLLLRIIGRLPSVDIHLADDNYRKTLLDACFNHGIGDSEEKIEKFMEASDDAGAVKFLP